MAAPINSSRALPGQGGGTLGSSRPPTRNGARRFGEFVDSRLSRLQNIRRWDGAARTSYLWDNLRRDPELWDNHGNCYVHLYGLGQSRRGPAFKLPFSLLVEQRCIPLLERFMAGIGPGPKQMSDVPRGRQPHRHVNYQQHQRRHHAHTTAADVIPEHKTATGAPEQRVDLYIPAPLGSDKDQALAYHLATRNFFAWLLRRSLVGEHLGAALSALFVTMREFRDSEYPEDEGREGVDNLGDLVAYMDEEGYLDFVGQPNNALAALFFAERFQIGDLYAEAFAHCAGMYESLHRSGEYRFISPVSRRQIRKARTDMDARLRKAGAMLRNFLEDDLSESHLGMTAGVRDHLDHFRAFIRRFYATAFSGISGTQLLRSAADKNGNVILSPQFYRAVRDDFEALYEYLVDERFSVGDSSPPLAQGGLCVQQSVEAFDRRHEHTSLLHPLPLLPEISPTYRGSSPSSSSLQPQSRPLSSSSRRLSWLSGGRGGDKTKLKADGRLVSHAALMRATNSSRVHLLDNPLVIAYRKFEEDAIVLSSAPSAGGVGGRPGSSTSTSGSNKSTDKKAPAFSSTSIVDARKVRWILIYCVYQTVRGCALPKESDLLRDVGEDMAANTPSYHIAVDLDNLRMPWEESLPGTPMSKSMRRQTAPDMMRADGFSPADLDTRSLHGLSAPMMMEIQPDVDYYALTHRGESRRSTPSVYSADGVVIIPPRRSSLTRSLSRSSTFRLSFGLFRSASGGDNRPATAADEVARAKTSAGIPPPSPSSPGIPARRRPVTAGAAIQRKKSTVVPAGPRKQPPSSSRRHSLYQEIVVQGYGNGTNHGNVSFGGTSTSLAATETEEHVDVTESSPVASHDTEPANVADTPIGTQRSASSASNTSHASDASSSAGISFATAATTAPSSPLVAEQTIPPTSSLPSLKPSAAAAAATEYSDIRRPITPTPTPPPALPARSPARRSLIFGVGGGVGVSTSTATIATTTTDSWPLVDQIPPPLRIRKINSLAAIDSSALASRHVDDEDYHDVDDDGDDSDDDDEDWRSAQCWSAPADAKPVDVWDQFADLGGHRELMSGGLSAPRPKTARG